MTEEQYILTEGEEERLVEIVGELKQEPYILRVTGFDEEERKKELVILRGDKTEEPSELRPEKRFRLEHLNELAEYRKLILPIAYTLLEAEKRGKEFKLYDQERRSEEAFEMLLFKTCYDSEKDHNEGLADEVIRGGEISKFPASLTEEERLEYEKFMKEYDEKAEEQRRNMISTGLLPLAELEGQRNLTLAGEGEHLKKFGPQNYITSLYIIDRQTKQDTEGISRKDDLGTRTLLNKVHKLFEGEWYGVLFTMGDSELKETFKRRFDRLLK